VTDVPSGENFSGDEEVTQYGRRDGTSFKNRPATGSALSAIRGRVSVEEACRRVTGRRQARPTDGVRVASVETLLNSGFTVRATPSRMNDLHVSIEYSGDWDDTVSESFDRCFGDPVYGDEPSNG